MTRDQSPDSSPVDFAKVVPLDSPVFQGVVGLHLTLGSAVLAETAAVPEAVVTAALALGVALLAVGVWRMLPRSVDDPARER